MITMMIINSLYMDRLYLGDPILCAPRMAIN